MKLTRNHLLPVLGMIVLLVFIVLSYTSYEFLSAKLLTCGLILSIIFLLRIKETSEEMKEGNSKFRKTQNN